MRQKTDDITDSLMTGFYHVGLNGLKLCADINDSKMPLHQIRLGSLKVYRWEYVVGSGMLAWHYSDNMQDEYAVRNHAVTIANGANSTFQ